VRFVPKSDPSKVLIGEPVDSQLDVGLALYNGKDVAVRPFSGNSVLNPGQVTDATETIVRVLSPLAQSEVGSIRCIGLNVSNSLNGRKTPLIVDSTCRTPRRCPSISRMFPRCS
jgi:hypothetical protein